MCDMSKICSTSLSLHRQQGNQARNCSKQIPFDKSSGEHEVLSCFVQSPELQKQPCQKAGLVFLVV